MELDHRLIISPHWSDLESALTEEVAGLKALSALQPVYILVGSNLLYLYLSRVLAQRSKESGLNLRFITFLDLAGKLSRGTDDSQSGPELPHLGRELLMRELALGLDDDDYFHPVARTRGFQQAALGAYRDIKDSRIQVALAHSGLLQAADWQEEGSRRKLKDFFRLFTRFEERRAGFTLDHDRFERAINMAHRFREFFSTDRVLTYGFYDFTAAQWSLLEALAQYISIIAFMPFQADSDIFAFSEKTLQRYEKLGFRLEQRLSFGYKASNLDTLKEYFGKGQAQAGHEKPDSSFKAIAAPGEDREVKAIAREILHLVKEHGIRLHEIGIILRNKNVYKPLFEEIFEAYNIPLFIQGGKPLADTPSARALMLFLNLAGSEFTRTEVMEFLSSGKWNIKNFFPDPEAGLPFRFDLLSREARVVQGKEKWLKKLSELGEQARHEIEKNKDSEAEHDEELLEKDQDIKNLLGFLREFFSDLESLEGQTTWKAMSGKALELARNYLDLDEEELKIFDDILVALGDLDKIDKDVEIDLFREMLESALKKTPAKQATRFQEGCVCLSELMIARGVRFRVLFIPGLVEKSFPLYVREDPIILDEERKLINDKIEKKGAFLPLKSEQILEEPLLFYLAMNQAEERLLLTWPRLDPEKNRERVPSFFLLRALEILSGRRLRFEDLKKQSAWVKWLGLSQIAAEHEDECLDTSDRDLYRTLKAGDRSEPAIGTYLGEVNRFLKRGASSMDSRLRVPQLTKYDGYVLSEKTRVHLEEEYQRLCMSVSPSHLEKWAECPFRYFLEHVIRLRIREDPEAIWEISPQDRGTFMHKTLENFFKKLKAQGRLPLTKADPEKLCTELEGEVIELSREYERQGLVGYPVIWGLDREDIVEELSEVIRTEISSNEVLLPEEFEKRFKVDFPLEDGQKVTLSGKMDRLDQGKGMVRVIDYKSGKPDGFKEDSFFRNNTLAPQLPVYLYAALKLENIEDPEGSRAEYLFISQKGKFKRIKFEGTDWQEKLDKLKSILAIILSGIRYGLFMPWQEDCQYCDYKLACFMPSKAWIEKKTRDKKASAYSRLQEFK